MALKVGQAAPDFLVVDADGHEVGSKDLQGRAAVVYFYPKDSTPGCTVEAQDFTALSERFDELGYAVYGVSPDSTKSHCRFRDKYDLEVRLLSDPDKAMLKAWGAWGEKKNYGRVYEGVIRSTVVLDASGKVLKHYPNVRAKGHAERVLADVEGLGACSGLR